MAAGQTAVQPARPAWKPVALNYKRAPPPPTHNLQPLQPGSTPYPAIMHQGARTNYPRQSGRTCDPPAKGQGLPVSSGETEWTRDTWRRARARFAEFERYAEHPVVRQALAYCRPCEVTMTQPRTEALGSNIATWTNDQRERVRLLCLPPACTAEYSTGRRVEVWYR
jgi:hypothetical protein